MTQSAEIYLPNRIEVVSSRRKTVELSLEGGRLVARAPHRMGRQALEPILVDLRDQLWTTLQHKAVFDDDGLTGLARDIAAKYLSDLDLPPYTIRFSARQKRRWGSCTREEDQGRIRVTDRLRGHPKWLVGHVVLHEIIHLEVPNHGPRFQRILDRDPARERAAGYLEALENVDQWQEESVPIPEAVVQADMAEHDAWDTLPLFANER